MACEQHGHAYCRVTFCVGDLAMAQGRVPGSFFGLLAKAVVMDNAELDATLDRLTRLHFSVESPVCPTNAAQLNTSHNVVLVRLQHVPRVDAHLVHWVLRLRLVDRLLLQLHHVAR